MTLIPLSADGKTAYYKPKSARKHCAIQLMGGDKDYRTGQIEHFQMVPDGLEEVSLDILPKSFPSVMEMLDRSYE